MKRKITVTLELECKENYSFTMINDIIKLKLMPGMDGWFKWLKVTNILNEPSEVLGQYFGVKKQEMFDE